MPLFYSLLKEHLKGFHESTLISRQATSVSLPKWTDNVGYEEGQERVLSKMTTGYPRLALKHSQLALPR
jgi:hypothetical protein